MPGRTITLLCRHFRWRLELIPMISGDCLAMDTVFSHCMNILVQRIALPVLWTRTLEAYRLCWGKVRHSIFKETKSRL